LLLARVVSTSLVQVSPSNPSVYSEAGVFTLVITVCAAIVPAARAARVDPIVALRYE